MVEHQMILSLRIYICSLTIDCHWFLGEGQQSERSTIVTELYGNTILDLSCAVQKSTVKSLKLFTVAELGLLTPEKAVAVACGFIE